MVSNGNTGKLVTILGLGKAFDRLETERLIKKLQQLQIDEKTIHWMELFPN